MSELPGRYTPCPFCAGDMYTLKSETGNIRRCKRCALQLRETTPVDRDYPNGGSSPTARQFAYLIETMRDSIRGIEESLVTWNDNFVLFCDKVAPSAKTSRRRYGRRNALIPTEEGEDGEEGGQ